ncbi:MAG: hypothetical protein KDA41_01255 [Planctomycetales bacterium]|nr:hypothetical protein [Planctomycetales bacterium]
MASKSLENRVANLESQMAEVLTHLPQGTCVKDWRRTIGAFTGDEGMLQILQDAMQLREADRAAARGKQPKSN